jgi:hypothetical protein
MTAWDLLLEKSSIAVGTAWQHLTSALQLGTGLVINDGVYVEIQNMEVEATLEDAGIVVEITENEVFAEIQDTAITIEVNE